MSKELVDIGERGRKSVWFARLIGMTAITAALLAPTGYESGLTDSAALNQGIAHSAPVIDSAPIIEAPPPIQVLPPLVPSPPHVLERLTRDTGMDMDACWRFTVCGTDLMVPFKLPNGSVGYMTGDTFAVKGPYQLDLPPGGDQWRSPVMIRSSETPVIGRPIHFDNAAGLDGNGVAPEFIYNSHRRNGSEVTVFPNDAVSLPDGSIVVSYQSVNGEITTKNANWTTNYSGLAISTDGNNFKRLLSGPNGQPGPGDPVWMNNGELDSAESQMWSMQLDGDYVYIISVRPGRTDGPMVMLRVPWQQIRDKGAYRCWNGSEWGGPCKALLPESKYGEPSLRKLDDGTPQGLWVMSYVDYTYTQLITRTAKSPSGPWSDPKIQMSFLDMNSLYGGFIHPDSTADNLILMVSTWQREDDDSKYGKLLRYDVSHLVTKP